MMLGQKFSAQSLALTGPRRLVGRLRSPAVVMLAIFGLVHGLYAAAGLRFDAYPLTHFWQYLDPELLRSRLAQSLLYLHSQPPLFNLFLGVVLKVAGEHFWTVFQVLYLAAGFGLYVSTAALMRRLGVSQLLAIGLSTIFLASPSYVLYEHWLFYTFPLAFILVVTALALPNLLERSRSGDVIVFCGSLFLLGATRSLYQLPYLVLVMVVAILLRLHSLRVGADRAGLTVTSAGPSSGAAPSGRKRAAAENPHAPGASPGTPRAEQRRIWPLILAATVTTALLLSIYLKNLALFGRFSSSSWLGMNLWGMIDRDLPLVERETLVATGQVSELAMIPRFSPLEDYPIKYRDVGRYGSIPALSQARKSTGAVNYNHIAFLAISDQYLADAMKVIRLRPRYFLIGIAKSWFNYFKPGSDNVFLESNLAAVAAPRDLYNTVVFGKLPFDLARIASLPLNTEDPRHLYLFLMIGLPLVTAYGLRLALKPPRGTPQTGMPAAPLLGWGQRWAVLYICLTVIYVACIGNLFELGENNRFRFETDPFFVVLFALLLQYALAPRLRRMARAARSWRSDS